MCTHTRNLTIFFHCSQCTLEEEPNGFQERRPCEDHIYSVSTVVSNWLKYNKPWFSRAFHFVNHDLLKFKLYQIGLNGKFYQAVNYLYRAPIVCVKGNEALTEWFSTFSLVKQGDVLSPTLFAVFINNLAWEVKQLGKGVICGSVLVSSLCWLQYLAGRQSYWKRERSSFQFCIRKKQLIPLIHVTNSTSSL